MYEYLLFFISLVNCDDFVINLGDSYFFFSFLSFFFNSSYPLFFFFALFFFFSSFFSLFLFQYLGLYGIFLLNLLTLFFFFISLAVEMPSFFFENLYYKFKLGKWMFLTTNFNTSFCFYVDSVAAGFMFLTVSIAIFVNIYAFAYFRYEPLVERLLVFLNLFVISMVILVTAGNLVLLFLGWELIGITSFFLINFWVARVGTLKAAFKAFSFNKFSDVSLFISIICMFFVTFDLEILTILNQLHLFSLYSVSILFWDFSFLDVTSFFLLSAAFVKSAQIGAHIWLPDSMEAPVPASALIHSATLVSAGIYLLLRFSKFMDLSSFCYVVVPLVGSLTAFVGGFVSMYQSDVKRTLAYSTISHCGFLMLISVLFSPEYVLLYLYVHGFFKAAVFLCVGNIIRFSKNYQDFRRMGLYYKYLPFECLASFVCLINLGGLPFTYGFFIKHYLFVVFNYQHWVWYLILVNAILASFTGIFYSSRLFFYVFFDFKKSKKSIYSSANRLYFRSKYFTNSSLAAMFSILVLIIYSYAVIYFFFFFFTSDLQLFSDLNKSVDFSSRLSAFSSSKFFLFNFFSTSFNIFFFYIFVLFISWRYSLYSGYLLNQLFFIITFFFLIFSFWYLI